MPQMSPLWWVFFPIVMVMVVIVMVTSFLEMLMDKEVELNLSGEDGVKMWW